MKFVYVLEDEEKFKKEVFEAIQFIDPKIQIRFFKSLQSFADWMKLMLAKGSEAIALGGEPYALAEPVAVPAEPHQLVCLVSKVEFLGVEQLGLLRKTREAMIQKGICTKEDPTSFVLTAFDNPEFEITGLEDRIITNVIFKPFDRLILIQHLTFAIDGRHPPSKYTIANQKTSAVIEMLKQVHIEAISDIGFISSSNRPIEVGAVAKYYASHFSTERKRSVIAICQACHPHPEKKDWYRVIFQFFANDPSQISNLRKKTRNPSFLTYNYDWHAQKSQGSIINFVVIDEDESKPTGLSSHIQKRMVGSQLFNYDNFSAFYSDLNPGESWDSRPSTLKAFSTGEEATLLFDSAGQMFFGVESEDKAPKVIFGVSEATLKNKGNWFQAALKAEHKDLFRQMITNQIKDPNVELIFEIMIEGQMFLVRALGVSKKNSILQIQFKELQKQEAVAYLAKNSKLPSRLDGIFVSHKFFQGEAKARWENVIQLLQQRSGHRPKIFMLSKQDFSDAEERELASYCSDIYFKPVDRIYFNQKMKSFFPEISILGEPVEVKTVKLDDTMKVASPVEISELSEAGIVMSYYRAIHIGSFREFVLWQPYEVGAPELLAQVNFVEEGADKKFNIHLVFFGMSDHFLKHIRVWIRDNYVLSKEGKGS